MEDFINTFKDKSRHHQKLINFLYPKLNQIQNGNILEFGVSEKGMSTQLFLEFSKKSNCKLFSIDNVNYSSKFVNDNWKFFHTRDDNFDFIKSNIPNKFKLIMLDTIHEADHVEKILYNYYSLLEKNCYFFIDDISWIPYLKNSDKNKFYCEVNNYETFERLLEIYNNNRENFSIEFSFDGTGMCRLKKLNEKNLKPLKKIKLRKYSSKNLIRKLLKR
tara:strand:+ start:1328 stop:1981 length:654 start_codon:yes stop_codon:yes gene_type:complete